MVKNGFRISGRTDAEGKEIVSFTPATKGWQTWFCGAGDDLVLQKRGDGVPIDLSWDAAETRGAKSVTVQFMEPVEMHDGQAFWSNVADWDAGDKLSLYLQLDATVVTVNATTGNCNLAPNPAGGNIIIPAAGDGTHDVALANAVPVDAAGAGYWDILDRETGVLTASTTPGSGGWHLLDVPIKAYFIHKLLLGNPLGVFDVDTYLVSYVHPNQKLIFEATKNSAAAGRISGWLQVFRKSVT